jgi:hypothetical protein
LSSRTARTVLEEADVLDAACCFDRLAATIPISSGSLRGIPYLALVVLSGGMWLRPFAKRRDVDAVVTASVMVSMW